MRANIRDIGDISVETRQQDRARMIMRATAYGGGVIGAIGAMTAGLLYGQAVIARRAIPVAEAPPPRSEGRYGAEYHGGLIPARPDAPDPEDIRLAVIGDSSAAGFGVERARDTTGALLAAGIAERLHRSVFLRCHAVVGATSSDLGHQVDRALSHHPDLAVILIGANDVTHRERVPVAVRHLAKAVLRLRAAGAEVVVCTCPDLGTVQPIPRPLRWLARRWSRELAAAQTVASVRAGARTVSLGDLLGPQFASAPDRMFASDRFHPSAIGYAAAASVILPTMLASLRAASGAVDESVLGEGEGVRSLVIAAAEAATSPGTEVSATLVKGHETGRAGRWAQLRHRVRQLVERPQDPSAAGVALPLHDQPD